VECVARGLDPLTTNLEDAIRQILKYYEPIIVDASKRIVRTDRASPRPDTIILSRAFPELGEGLRADKPEQRM